ncbi:MAG: chromosome segregation protein SMC, partial [Deltaproteobacteria bacterium]|nr:chromosome segregation protein SMC [Deltaproteobacteria bacterium]
GTEKKGPQNMAEVILTLVNDNGSTPEEFRQFTEIMVGRRLYRSGESQYSINKQPCRLKDVQNLLMGTGLGPKAYAIIEQGKIGALIDAGPEERRYFIEEAAGITRYKSRKHEALLKIKRTQQNLLRISDVVSEIKRQMNSLKRQVRKAERFKSYQKTLKGLEILLAVTQVQALQQALNETDTLLQSLRDTDFQHASELAKLDAAVEQIKQERATKHQSISEQRTRRNELQRTLDRLEGDIEYRVRDLERLNTEIEEIHAELQSIGQKSDEIAEECLRLEERKTTLDTKIASAKEAATREAELESVIKAEANELDQSLEANKTKLIDLAGRKATYENTLENASRNKTNLSRRLDQLEHEKENSAIELERLDQKITKIETDRLQLKQTLEETESALQSLEARLQENREALGRQVRKVQKLELIRQKARSQYNALKKMDENYEWFKQGVRSVMQQWKSGKLERAGIHGLVADIIEAEPSYENAVEAALGEKLQYIIVGEQAGGMAAIDTLHTLSGGRGSFVPVSGLRPLANQSGKPDSQDRDLLMHHITVREGYDDVIHGLLCHVAVSESLESAIAWWKQQKAPWAVVTKDGNRVSPQGILTGGSRENSGNGILAKKKELNDLATRVSELGTVVQKAKAKQQDLEMETISLETQVQQTRQDQNRRNQTLLETEKALYGLSEQRKHAGRHLEILRLEEQQIEGERSDIEQELASHQDVLVELKAELDALEHEIQKTQVEREKALERLETAKETLVEYRLQLTAFQAEHENTGNTLRRLAEFQQDRTERQIQLKRGVEQAIESKAAANAQLKEDRTRLSELYATLEVVDESLNQSEEEYQAIEGAVQQNDQAISEVRTRKQEINRKIQALELKQSERRIRCDHIATGIQEKYHHQLDALLREQETEVPPIEETERHLTKLKEKIARIGDVNLTAIEEYEGLSERYTLLTQQRDDLDEAIEALHRVIRKINRISLKRFMRTFKAVNQKVQEVFPKLFEGGLAQLALTNPKKPLESGVSFLVRPPGKKLTRMSLLSGGEKALSAIALVFSLFLIKPAAFCVLDEIDAPLDDVNVYRFNQLLKEIAKQSQVVMITHDRQTMEVANALFGVTMEQKGISKLISLDMSRS